MTDIMLVGDVGGYLDELVKAVHGWDGVVIQVRGPRRSQVAMIGEENRLSDRSARDIRAFRAAHSVPDVPLRILTATRDKPPSMQRHYEELAARTASAFRRGSHEVVGESGHYIHHDQLDAVVKAVGDIGVR